MKIFIKFIFNNKSNKYYIDSDNIEHIKKFRKLKSQKLSKVEKLSILKKSKSKKLSKFKNLTKLRKKILKYKNLPNFGIKKVGLSFLTSDSKMTFNHL